jgi:hypothetical protein
MQTRRLTLRAHSRIAALPFLTGLLLLAGCGSSRHSTSTSAATSTSNSPCPPGQQACISRSPQAKTVEHGSLAADLVKELKKSNSQLSHVRLACPPLIRYPVTCRLTAIANGKGKVAGTVKALGVVTQTGTYATVVIYGPPKH